MKANPENVAKAMTGTLQNEENERVFQISDFLTHQQVASYFTRMPNLQSWPPAAAISNKIPVSGTPNNRKHSIFQFSCTSKKNVMK